MTRSRPRIGGVVVVAVLVAIVGGAVLFGHVRQHWLPDLSRFDVHIEASAKEFDVDPNLVRGLMAAESGGDPDAVSHAGAVGLLQLMPPTAQEQATRLRIPDYAERRLTEPALNVRLGTSYLARLLRYYDGEEAYALAGYNAGLGRVNGWRKAAPDLEPAEVIRTQGFEETRNHLERVLRFREQYRARYPNER